MIATARAVAGEHGVVAAPDPRAASAGVSMLEAGGNAFDAAIATAFAIGVIEPYMSGSGGGAWLSARIAPTGRRIVIEGPLVSGWRAHESMYELSGGAGGLYGWPSVAGSANTVGPLSVAVPGQVAALAEASAFGRLGLARCLEPAIELARGGIEANWLMTTCIVSEMARLRDDRGARELFLRDGIPLTSAITGPADVLVQERLAATLERIAENGAAEMYSGQTSEAIVSHLALRGGILDADDFARYEARVHTDVEPWEFDGLRMFGPVHTGVATVVQTLRLVEALQPAGISRRPTPSDWTRALDLALAERLERMSADPVAGTDWVELLSAKHAEKLLGQGSVRRPGGASGCTSQITATDADGTVVSLTQTVLDLFGSRMVEPETGVLLNDGMMYFDPRPGRANSIRASSPGLSAVSPVIVEHGEQVTGIGASGGRRIMSCVAQLVAAISAGDTVQQAIDRPRVHAENGTAVLDARLIDAAAEISGAGFDVDLREEEPTTWHFARPNGITVANGSSLAGVDPYKPYGMQAARGVARPPADEHDSRRAPD